MTSDSSLAAAPRMNPRQLVVGGRTTQRGEYSHHVALLHQQADGQQVQVCGGSLISERHVLTAAHCIYEGSKKRSTSTLFVAANRWARAGDADSACSETLGVRQADAHPSFSAGSSLDNDLAVLELEQPTTCGHHVVALAPAGSEMAEGTIVEVLGWGPLTSYAKALPPQALAPPLLPTHLQVANLTLFGWHSCSQLFQALFSTNPFSPSMLCTYDNPVGGSPRGPCSGDSGGPLTLPLLPADNSRPVQVGVVSWSLRNATHSLCDAGVGVYASVSFPQHREWILQQINLPPSVAIANGNDAMPEWAVALVVAGTASCAALLALSLWARLRRRHKVAVDSNREPASQQSHSVT